MKKQLLLLSVIALNFALSSCKKDIAAVNGDTKTTSKLKINTLPAPTYVDLALVPRQPGENYDTYHTNYHGSSIYVVGAPVYDAAKYPTLVNGIPAYAQSMYADNGASIDFQNTGTDGNVFQVTQTLFSYTDQTIIHKDEENYFKAVDQYDKLHDAGAPPPSIFNYVKTNYTSSNGGVLIFTGKIICVTTGSHYALSEINYPLPVSGNSTTIKPGFEVSDPLNPHITYLFNATSGKQYTSALVGVDYNYPAASTSVVTSVTAIQVTPGTPVWRVVGTVTRADGSFFNINFTQDLS